MRTDVTTSQKSPDLWNLEQNIVFIFFLSELILLFSFICLDINPSLYTLNKYGKKQRIKDTTTTCFFAGVCNSQQKHTQTECNIGSTNYGGRSELSRHPSRWTASLCRRQTPMGDSPDRFPDGHLIVTRRTHGGHRRPHSAGRCVSLRA